MARISEQVKAVAGIARTVVRLGAPQSITSLTDGAGALASTYQYDSFGNATSTTGAIANPYRYTGREYDLETSLYYYRARYYDPQIGRFMSEDSLKYSPAKNKYRYVMNSPLILTDPSGHVEECTLVGSSRIRLLNDVTREFPSPWQLVQPYAEDPSEDAMGVLPAPIGALHCLWERFYARVTWGNALRVLTFQCIETNSCGLPPRRRFKYEFKRERWFIRQTRETERTTTAAPIFWGSPDILYEMRCRNLTPNW